MRSIFFILIIGLIVACVQAKKDSALETKLNELIPNRFLNQFNDGWKQSLAVLQVKDVLSLPKIYGRSSEIDSRKALETIISEESPNLYKVMKGTQQALKKKHDEKMGSLSKDTKAFIKYVLNAFNGFSKNMVNKYKQQNDAVQQEIKTAYPTVEKLGALMLDTLDGVIKSVN